MVKSTPMQLKKKIEILIVSLNVTSTKKVLVTPTGLEPRTT